MATVGQPVVLPYRVLDSTGNLIDPASMSIVVTLPDATTATLALDAGIARQAARDYYGLFVPTQAGRHTWTGSTTGPTTSIDPDAFNVTAATDAPLVGLAEARAWLNIDVPDYDVLIRRALAKATEVAEQWTGETFRRSTFVEVHDGGRSELNLQHLPVLSIVSVVENGVTLVPGDYTLDALAGLLKRGSTQSWQAWLWGRQNIVVTLVAGYSVVPDRYLGGVEELTRHIFRSISTAGGDADDAYVQTAALRQLCATLLGPAIPAF